MTQTPTEHFATATESTPVTMAQKRQITRQIKNGLRGLLQNVSACIEQNSHVPLTGFRFGVFRDQTVRGSIAPTLKIQTETGKGDEQSVHVITIAFKPKRVELQEALYNSQEGTGNAHKHHHTRFTMLSGIHTPMHPTHKSFSRNYRYNDNTVKTVLEDSNRLLQERCLPKDFGPLFAKFMAEREMERVKGIEPS